MKIGIILFLIAFIIAGVKLVGFLQKKGVFINRWVFGFSAFLIVLIPVILFENLPTGVMNGLYILSGLFAIMFFETGRIMMEKNQVKGVIRASHFPKKNKK
ncbi:hypothetical protein JHE06_07720 [Carnobacterium sp. CS13]|uniref:hypothetical protein n=1 Tax=Carnobacterium sp. CS13 TaxID=2800128 RepID=UPI001912F0AC|nr:hypothetical protein [Carnobacterium sp. CS13]QQP69506.1 hypothetical protein JHE06_07720 [Carnobacterium sp. CS13]